MARQVNVAVIGTGVGRLHLRGYAQVPDVKILGLCDLDEAEARRFADEYGVPHVFTDYRDLLNLDGLDAVSVCTPTDLHAPMTIAALKAGLHVLCEKPMALNVAEAKRMVAAAKKAKRRLMIGMSLRFMDATQAAYDVAVKRRALGRVYYARASMLRPRAFPGTYPKTHSMARGAWFADKKRSGGGALLDIGVHTFDCAWHLMGRPTPHAITARTYLEVAKPFYKKHGVPIDVEELASVFVKFADGASMLLDVSWGLNAKKGFSIQVMGTKAGLDLTPTLYRDGPDGAFTGEAIPLPEHVEGEQEHFVNCIRNGRRKSLSPAEDGLMVTRVLEAIYKSAESDREVKVRLS